MTTFIETDRYKGHDHLTTEACRNLVAAVAPKGSRVYIHVRKYGDHYRLRLWAVNATDSSRILTDIAAINTEELFRAVVAELAYDADLITFWKFHNTLGDDGIGYGWPLEHYSNVPLGILYALAKVVHGDRNAWRACYLDGPGS